YIYDANNKNIVKVIDPGHSASDPYLSFTYYTGAPGPGYPGALHTVTDANNHTTTYENYDANGLATQLRDAKGFLTKLTYDSSGLLRTVQDPLHGGDPI